MQRQSDQLAFDFVAQRQVSGGDSLAHPAAAPAMAGAVAAASPAEIELRRRQLSRELRLHTGSNVALVLHSNRHSMLSAERTRMGYLVRAHRIFGDAPPDVVLAIARLLDSGDREAGRVVDRYIVSQAEQIIHHAKPQRIEPQGKVYNLQPMFDRLNRDYFDARVQARVTWGRSGSGRLRTGRTRRRKRTIKLGSYHPTERLIRLHPALDQATVPTYFIEFVLFHEMLHEQIGISHRESDGRRCVHPPEFRALEARFPFAAEAQEWERSNIERLLRYRDERG